jgi:hypothetical protein
MTSFAMVIPPGWTRIDLTADVATQAGQLVATLRSQLVDGPSGLDVLLEEMIGDGLAAAAASGAVAMIMPADPRIGGSASVMIRPFEHTGDPVDAVVRLAARDSSATLIDVEGLVCLRTLAREAVDAPDRETVARLTTLAPGKVGSIVGPKSAVRVRYIVGDPNDATLWADVLGSTTTDDVEAGQELVNATVQVFDAMVATFRWLP